MSTRWWHIVGLILLGYLIGYYMPALGDMTAGKLFKRG